MGDKHDKRKRKRNNKEFNFAPTKKPKEIQFYLSGLRRENMKKSTEVSPEHKSALKSALADQDVSRIKRLLADGICVNIVIDEEFWDTPLTFAIKHSLLEVVEALVSSPSCDVNFRSRNKYTSLDEAVRVWLTGGSTLSHKQNRARRFRVLRCLLSAGAREATISFLDNLIYSCLNTRSGLSAVDKLVKVVSQKGHRQVKTALLGALISHANAAHLVRQLLISGADTKCILTYPLSCVSMAGDHAAVLIKATNQSKELALLEKGLVIPRNPRRQWNIGDDYNGCGPLFAESLKLLVLTGHVLSLSTMNYMYKHHATLYKKAVASLYEPRPLKDIARIKVRQYLRPNVFYAASRLKSLPDQIKTFLMFTEN